MSSQLRINLNKEKEKAENKKHESESFSFTSIRLTMCIHRKRSLMSGKKVGRQGYI